MTPRATRRAALLFLGLELAACAPASAAEPFPVVPQPPPEHQSHLWAYTSMAAGAGLIGVSFAFSHKADQTYDQYLAATDPNEISSLYDQTIFYDRWSTGTLLTGELLIVTGLYLRFLRPHSSRRVSLEAGPRTCALALHF